MALYRMDPSSTENLSFKLFLSRQITPQHSLSGSPQLFLVLALCAWPSQHCSQLAITYLSVYLFMVCLSPETFSQSLVQVLFFKHCPLSTEPSPPCILNEWMNIMVSEWLTLWYTLPITKSVIHWLISKKWFSLLQSDKLRARTKHPCTSLWTCF